MSKRFVFCYQMVAEDQDRIRETVPAHVEYWHRAGLEHYTGGPFADRTGGLITFAAADLEEANDLAANDPFRREALLSDAWVREWLV